MDDSEIPAMLARQVAAVPDATAISDGAVTRTWRELAERVARWVAVLRAGGIQPGDAAALLLGNRVETFEALLACLHRGVTAVPVNWHLTATEAAYQLTDADCRVLVVDEQRAAVGAEAATARVSLRLVTGDRPYPGFTPVEPALAGVDPALPPVLQDCGQLMIYTSGTTGRPKGVLNGLFAGGAPFRRVDALLRYASQTLGVPADGRVLLVGPWYHSAQLFFALLPLLNGAGLVIHPRFDAEAVLATLQESRITECHLVPTQLVRLLRLDPAVRARFTGGSLRRVWHGGAACPVDVKRAMLDWWGPVLVEYYAATEGGVVTLIEADEWLARPGSVGRAVAPNRVLIVDEHGTELGPGRTGRVYVQRPGRSFTYHRAEAKTRDAHLRPGVFTYGEVGHLDADGYLFLTGRAQQMVVTGGVNVYPAEVEAVLATHPLVRDAAVLGLPDAEFGERVAAVVELAPDAGDDPWPLLDEHCRRSLAGFKVPRQYRAVARMPRDETGKIRAEILRGLWESHAVS
ncbi:AMP-binding protein [Micromonospora sp. R77]|uniref:AMP-binding protein n=1 Tax=Micromonospora sp. R77 TaxID=2925836 RepID=UPI001F61340A|nr:AMP-binding protein [Micromonospora sp. R77]MCI4066472.1 AMP-binding protein [Micromonospora sp. R77]